MKRSTLLSRWIVNGSLPLVTLSLVCVIFVSRASAQDDDSTSPPAKILPVTPEIETALTNAMQGCPATGRKIHAGINKNGVYTLTGNLFHNGQTNALIDNHDNIVIGEWKGREWKATAMINAAPTWKSPSSSGDDVLALASSKPFWMLLLQGNPLLVVASTLVHGNQKFTVLLFDPKTSQLLDLCSSYQDKPTIKDGLLVCSQGSSNKSDWETTYFYKIQNRKFNLIASSGWSSPWRSDGVQEPDTYTVKSKSNIYVFIFNSGSLSSGGAEGTVTKPLGGGIDIMHISNKGQPYATVSFNLERINDMDLINRLLNQEVPYITSKLSGLPKEFFLDEDIGDKRFKIEKLASIKVTGSPEAVKLLST